MYHVAPQSCAGHGGEVGCSSVVFAAADDCDSSELTFRMLELKVSSVI